MSAPSEAHALVAALHPARVLAGCPSHTSSTMPATPPTRRLRALCGQLVAPDPSSPPHPHPAPTAASGGIPPRALFRGGPQVSCIGFGAWPIGGAHGNVERDVGKQAVITAVEEVGMTFVDTAEAYELEMQGGSETLIGQALTERPDLRETAFVTTKVSNGPFTANGIKRSVERSLGRLQTCPPPLPPPHHRSPATFLPCCAALTRSAAARPHSTIPSDAPSAKWIRCTQRHGRAASTPPLLR